MKEQIRQFLPFAMFGTLILAYLGTIYAWIAYHKYRLRKILYYLKGLLCLSIGITVSFPLHMISQKLKYANFFYTIVEILYNVSVLIPLFFALYFFYKAIKEKLWR